jgi:hypothetical protein
MDQVKGAEPVTTDLDHRQPAVKPSPRSTTVDASSLLELERGIAYVESVTFDSDVTTVRLLYPTKRRAQIVVPAVPGRDDFRQPTSVDRLLAIDVRRDALGVRCSAIGTSRRGPRRLSISLAQALAHAHLGVHTVFRAE